MEDALMNLDRFDRNHESPGYVDLDLRRLIQVLWDGKWLIGGITLAVTVIAVVVALMLPNIYRAEALLASNDQDNAGGLSSLAAQYGGLASLAGISLDNGKVDKTELGLEILQSRRFVSDFVDRHDILVPLIASSGWDQETDELTIDPGIYDVETQKWVRAVSPPKKLVPSTHEAYKAFTQVLSVSEDKKTGFITVAIEFFSPSVAKQWVDWLVDDINSEIMRQDVEQAEQAIEYLNEQIESTSLAALQNVFFRLIEEQTKTVMLARVSSEYMFRTLDPAVAPELKARPKRAFIAALGMVLGGMIGLMALLLRNIYSSNRS